MITGHVVDITDGPLMQENGTDFSADQQNIATSILLLKSRSDTNRIFGLNLTPASPSVRSMRTATEDSKSSENVKRQNLEIGVFIYIQGKYHNRSIVKV